MLFEGKAGTVLMRINKEENIQASDKGLPITAVFVVVVVATKEVDEGVVRPTSEKEARARA